MSSQDLLVGPSGLIALCCIIASMAIAQVFITVVKHRSVKFLFIMSRYVLAISLCVFIIFAILVIVRNNVLLFVFITFFVFLATINAHILIESYLRQIYTTKDDYTVVHINKKVSTTVTITEQWKQNKKIAGYELAKTALKDKRDIDDPRQLANFQETQKTVRDIYKKKINKGNYIEFPLAGYGIDTWPNFLWLASIVIIALYLALI